MSEKIEDDLSNSIKKNLRTTKISEKIFVMSLLILISLILYSQNYDSIFVKDAHAKEKEKNSKLKIEKYNNNFLCFENQVKKLSSISKSDKSSFCSRKLDLKEKQKRYFQKELDSLVVGFPIDQMTESISQYDRKAAAFIVAIAKKESNWGKRSPAKNGKTCYNYWGYKGSGNRGSSLGYACFASPEEAVLSVGKKIKNLVNQGFNTPSKMLVWKCGNSCKKHNPDGVRKWVNDVQIYFSKIVKK